MFRRATLAALAAIGINHVVPGTADAQAPARNQVVMMREIDADRYDPHRSTALAAGEALTLMSDTLVNLDYDMRTLRPGLAERWEVSPDGLVYTFHLRRDVTFCDGKPMTAEDVVFSINRWIAPATRSPVAWRAWRGSWAARRRHQPTASAASPRAVAPCARRDSSSW